MPNKSDMIENYIRRLLQLSGERVELNRSELAVKFACSPSQINYVLETRFTVERGYLVESRRGGGGYLRVTRSNIPLKEVWARIDDQVEQKEAEDILDFLRQEKVLSWREAAICRDAVDASVLKLPPDQANRVRSRLLRAFLARVGSSFIGPGRFG